MNEQHTGIHVDVHVPRARVPAGGRQRARLQRVHALRSRRRAPPREPPHVQGDDEHRRTRVPGGRADPDGAVTVSSPPFNFNLFLSLSLSGRPLGLSAHAKTKTTDLLLVYVCFLGSSSLRSDHGFERTRDMRRDDHPSCSAGWRESRRFESWSKLLCKYNV